MSDLESNPDNVSASSIPETIAEWDRWVCWRYEQDRDKKPPYDPETGEKASIREQETWGDFETALEAYEREDYDGLGFVLTEGGSLTGFDFDKCRDPETGEIKPEVESVIDRLDSYSEISPSGTGIHTLIIGKKPDEYGNKDGSHIEVYDSVRYFTVTGNHLGGTPETIEERNEELQAICAEHLAERGSEDTNSVRELPGDDQDEAAIKEAREYIRGFMHGQETGPRAREYYSDLLKGKYAERGFADDRSGAETTLCSLTYGILLDGGADPEKARNLTYHYITHAVTENPRTEEQRKVRKWLEGPPKQQRDYRQNTLNYATSNFVFEIWDRWRQSGHRTSTNDYCKKAYEIAYDVLNNLSAESALANPPHLSTNNTPETGYSEHDTPYPTMGEIAEQAEKEYELVEDSYREILRRLRRDGQAKMARIGQHTYVYYPANFPDPVDACKVKVEGEEYEPTSKPDDQESGSEVMTDGGIRRATVNARQDINRIRQARAGDNGSTDSPEVHTCPIDGCSRTVIGESGHLMNHVQQSSDDAHRYQTLTENLEVEFNEEAYHNDWGPGIREPELDETQSIYDDYDGLWGPGIPA